MIQTIYENLVLLKNYYQSLPFTVADYYIHALVALFLLSGYSVFVALRNSSISLRIINSIACGLLISIYFIFSLILIFSFGSLDYGETVYEALVAFLASLLTGLIFLIAPTFAILALFGIIGDFESRNNDNPIYGVWVITGSCFLIFLCIGLASTAVSCLTVGVLFIVDISLEYFHIVSDQIQSQATLILITLLFVYFLPTIISVFRGHHNKLAIFFTNTLLGWTVIGWVFSIIWSGTKVQAIRVND